MLYRRQSIVAVKQIQHYMSKSKVSPVENQEELLLLSYQQRRSLRVY